MFILCVCIYLFILTTTTVASTTYCTGRNARSIGKLIVNPVNSCTVVVAAAKPCQWGVRLCVAVLPLLLLVILVSSSSRSSKALPVGSARVCREIDLRGTEQRLGHLFVSPALHAEGRAEDHLVKAVEHGLQCALRQTRELVYVNVHLHIVSATITPIETTKRQIRLEKIAITPNTTTIEPTRLVPYKSAGVADQHGLAVVGSYKAGQAELLDVLAAQDDLKPTSPGTAPTATAAAWTGRGCAGTGLERSAAITTSTTASGRRASTGWEDLGRLAAVLGEETHCRGRGGQISQGIRGLLHKKWCSVIRGVRRTMEIVQYSSAVMYI